MFLPVSILHLTKEHVLTQIKHQDLQNYRGSKNIKQKVTQEQCSVTAKAVAN